MSGATPEASELGADPTKPRNLSCLHVAAFRDCPVKE